MPDPTPPTAPIPGLGTCGWCGIRLTAVPGPYPDYRDRLYHSGGCIGAARSAALVETRLGY